MIQYLLETLKLRDDYSPEMLAEQSRNLVREKETVARIVAEIKRRKEKENEEDNTLDLC